MGKECQSNRKQFIEIRDKTQGIKSSSSTRRVVYSPGSTNGVPQGSVQGPSFFSIAFESNENTKIQYFNGSSNERLKPQGSKSIVGLLVSHWHFFEILNDVI